MSNHIEVPKAITINDIKNTNFSLSATQYKKFVVKTKNLKKLRDILSNNLSTNLHLGKDVGSDKYMENGPIVFIKTKAIQNENALLNFTKESIELIMPINYKKMKLKKGDLLISKDSNVGETVILDKDYKNCTLCGSIYNLPILEKFKMYFFAFSKTDMYTDQIDFLVPKSSTIRHGKTLWLDIEIPFSSDEYVTRYVTALSNAYVQKEIAIKKKYELAIDSIENELLKNQLPKKFKFSNPNIKEILNLGRLDSSLYSKIFKQNEFIIKNYMHGTETVKEIGFNISRGQNLQYSNIGATIESKSYVGGYYRVILPMDITIYGTIMNEHYLGNNNKLKELREGDLIFGAEGNEKGRSIVIVKSMEKCITNIHGITLKQSASDISQSIYVKFFLDYLRKKGMIDEYAVGGNGGSLAIQYWDIIPFPKFPQNFKNMLSNLYYTRCDEYNFDFTINDLEKFIEYDTTFNENAGIFELGEAKEKIRSMFEKVFENIGNEVNPILNIEKRHN